ncbi:MAG: peptidoglycan-binding protein, partial [Alphaproteobacteria bacterium]
LRVFFQKGDFMFTLKRSIARDTRTDFDDVAAVTFALAALGYYDDTETGLSPYADDGLFRSIKSFQKDNDLKDDGVMKTDGPTQAKMNDKLKSDEKSVSAFGVFWRNYIDMREVQLDGADKYFHCKANYEATEKGWATRAENLSDQRAWYKKNIKKDSNLDVWEDQGANIWGREAAKTGKYKSASEACEIHRPEGLDEKY